MTEPFVSHRFGGSGPKINPFFGVWEEAEERTRVNTASKEKWARMTALSQALSFVEAKGLGVWIDGKAYVVPNATKILGRAIGAVRRGERSARDVGVLNSICRSIAGGARWGRCALPIGRWNEVRKIAEREPTPCAS